MRRMTSAVAVVAATLFTCLFTASVAGAQAPDATISVTGNATSWSPQATTVTTGDTVRWSFTGSNLPHNVHGTSANWNPPLDSDVDTDQDPVDYTFNAPGTYTFVCDVHGTGMGGTVTVEADSTEDLDNVLLFTKTQTEPTATFRHASIDEGIAAIQALGAANDFAVDATEDSTDFTDANLAQFDVVIFLSTTGDILNDTQQAAFERYIQSGGGFAGIHAASDTEYTWPWFGELVGGYFRSHPPGTPQATVEVEDADEPSTEDLPASWVRTDEWYNFQHPTTPIVGGNGTVADYSPRARHVHVLATVDEGTYGEEDGNTVDDDHPVAWCSDFAGGRSWYTAMGHTEASFADSNFRQHLLGGLRTAAGEGECGERRDMPPTAEEFEKVTLNNDTNAPMEIDIAEDGRAFYIELDGRVQMWSPTTQQTTTVGTIPVELVHENGMLGIQLAPDFATSGHIYLAYSVATPQGSQFGLNNVSRFTLTGNTLGQQQIIYQWQHQRAQCCHTGGSLDFGPDGNLYLSTGDNTNPFAHGFNPTDERAGRQFWDAQRTSANSNDPNGKILRIRPIPNATGVPGIGTTYTIPTGNLFDEVQDTQNRTLPEIYAMGFRNPFRIHVDQETGWVLMGDYGPDAGSGNAGRGPQGSVEFNVVKEPGFYGWPYCVRQNTPYHDITYTNDAGAGTDNGEYNCAAPVNNSPNNTGLTNLPPAIPATMWMGYSDLDQRFVPDLGGGGAPTGGARYYYDEESDSETKFPRFYDGHWFIGEWNVDWVKTTTLNDQGLATGVACFAVCGGYISPMDLEFGPDGSLYVVEWGQGFNENNPDSGVYRIDYVRGARAPQANATASADAVPVGTQVNFSSAGSNDPDGTALTYLWDFDNGTTSTAPNPSHTFTAAGTYDVTLTVTDEAGDTGVDTVRVIVGNERPVVTIVLPEDGKVADLGETVAYEISVDDPDGGSTEEGTIDCDDVRIELKLGHDTHAHELESLTGCEGEFSAAGIAGHGTEANIFTVITANYTDAGNGPAAPVTGSDEAIVQPRLKQAEFWATTGRTADARGGGDPGVVNEATTDVGGTSAAAFIEDGDWISFTPYNLEDLDKATFRVASGGAGGMIELRYDAANGPLVAATPLIAPTGGWQTWRDVTIDLPEAVPEGTHRLFIVFRHPTDTGGLMNLNWFKFIGKGAAVTAPPEVTATADPSSGDAPLQVEFDAVATDAEGEALEYEWDFGVAGTTQDTSTEEDPTYTYAAPGNYVATVTVTDASGGEASASVAVQVTRGGQCPPTNQRSDEFEGDALDLNRWQIIRPNDTRPPSVSGGNLNFPIDNGSLYATGTSARNIIVQPLPDGDVEVTAKITTDPLTENYQQAGLRVYQDDDNWASVHMIWAGSGRDFEFIYENAGGPRNGAADKLGGIPTTFPNTYWVKLISDGSTLTAQYSDDGEEFLPVGQPASIAGWADPKVGPVALSDQAATYPVARFDWIRFDPDATGGGGGGGSETELFADQFDGTELGSSWTVVRGSQALDVSGGALRYPAATGDLYQADNTASNLVLRAAPASGPWTATAKINFEGFTQYQQAGIIAYGGDNEYVKLGRIAHTTGGDEKFEFIHEANAIADNTGADSTQNIAATFPDDYWVQLRYDGTNLTGWYSENGSNYTQAGRAWPLPANTQLGLFAFGNTSTSAPPEAAFDSFLLTRPGAPAGPSRDDEFAGATLDKDRWNAIVRDTPAEYELSGGEFTITTSQGDIFTGDTNPPPNNFILQEASHAGTDWTIETKIPRASIIGEYAQGGLIAYVDGNNYVKFDVISDDNNTRINRIELRSEVGGLIQNPQQNVTIPEANDDGPFYLRLTKAGTNYSGEYSFDGVTWMAFPGGSVPNAMQSPDFGLFAFSPQPEAVGDTVTFDYFWLNGQDPPDECECETGNGDEFDSGPLDQQRWNNIVREDPTKYSIQNGKLAITTVAGDIYTTGDPLPTRNFILQTADHAGADWVIETSVDVTQITNGGYEQGGLLAYKDDNNYVKFDPVSDPGNTDVNRIELRSEVAGVIGPNPPDVNIPDGTTNVWLRMTKTGTSYAGEVSFNGTTWTPLASPVTNAMTEPSFGIYTLGQMNSGHVIAFDYFALDGNRGDCEEPEPENRAPVIDDLTATPQSGFAPLLVAFSATASDPDTGDTLTYAWDFDGDGDTDSTVEDPTYTYAAAGDYEAELTVSDGEDETTRTVAVSVFGPTDPQARFRVLVFSKTAGFRHDSIDEGHAAIEQLGADNDFQVDHTEDASIFNAAALANYDTVVFLSTTGDVLNAAQQTAFEDYIQGGGGFTGIHAAADTEYEWKWYGNLVGAYFLSHPPGTPEADVIVEDTDDHTTQGLPAPIWHRTDEWYNYKPVNFEQTGNVDYSPRASGVHVLLRLDESTYDEQDGNATDDDHPISWCQRYDGGRSWYTGMGHTAASFAEADYLEHLLGGIEVSAGFAESEGCDAVDPDAPIVEAFAEPTSGTAPLVVQFSSSAIDPNGGPLGRTRYRWEFGDGGSAFGASPRHRYTAPGTYDAVLTVTDPEGKSTSKTIPITVHPPGGQAPVVATVADPTSGQAPLEVRFEAAATDPDGRESRLTYRWDFGDDAGAQFGRVVRHTYMEPGEYEATVTVTDEAGVSTTSDPIAITVENPPGNVPPTVEAAADPVSGTAPLRVRFSSDATDPDGDQLLITWAFGDGGQGAGERVEHTYTMPGTYDARVTVRDVGGLTATDTVRVTVTAAAGSGGQGVAAPLPAASGGGDVSAQSVAAPVLQVTKSHNVARVVRRGLRYTVACAAECRVTSTLRIAGADNQRLGKAAARNIAAGASRTLVLRLDRNVRRNLVSAMRKAKLSNLRATLVLKIRTAEGTTTVRRAVVLRR